MELEPLDVETPAQCAAISIAKSLLVLHYWLNAYNTVHCIYLLHSIYIPIHLAFLALGMVCTHGFTLAVL